MNRFFLIVIILIPVFVTAQSSWKREKQLVEPPLELFHSIQTANLPTSETLKKGDFFYEISHRFGKINGGYEAFYGLDGPVTMRTALSYGISDELTLTAGRSNIQDNLDINAKYMLWAMDSETVPLKVALRAGFAFNTETYAGVKKRDAFDGNSSQYYFQVVLNTMFFEKKLGVGLVPSFVYNSYIFANEFDEDKKYSLSLPLYTQYYFNRMWSIWVEYTPVLSGWQGSIFSDPSESNRSYNAIAGGIAMETGGHVFHLFVTNSTRLNPTQYLVGADNDTGSDAWHFAFGITREL